MALSPTDDNGAALRGHDRGDARRLRQRVAARGGGRAAAKSHSRVVFSFSVVIQRCHSALSLNLRVFQCGFVCYAPFLHLSVILFRLGRFNFIQRCHSAISFSDFIQRCHSESL